MGLHGHRHRHAHMHKRQKVICPIGEDCKLNENNNPCHHAYPHIDEGLCCKVLLVKDSVEEEKCPNCIKTQEVIEEETFTEEEFQL